MYSCYYCFSSFDEDDVVVDHDVKFCPHCGIDAVFKEELTKSKLEELNEKYFGGITANI